MRVLASEPGLDAQTRARLAVALQEAVAMVGTRHPVRIADAAPEAVAPEENATPVSAPTPDEEAAAPEPTAPVRSDEPFDPYSPNVIVVFRTRGRDAALEELHSIDDVECLRLLAREQQLGISADLADPTAIRQAIVAAAERRVANRRAAAS